MGISDINSTKTYTKYKRHVNDSSERIDAMTINQLQTDIQQKQESINEIKDTSFEERVYTIFDNNLFTNAMFIDNLSSGKYINGLKKSNINLDPKKAIVELNDKTSAGYFNSIEIYSVHGKDIELNDLFLIANEYKPMGSKIEYTIILANGERFSITPNALKTPLHFYENIKQGFTLLVSLVPNGLGESPYLSGYAILYWDAQVELNLGITNPDLKRFPGSRNRL